MDNKDGRINQILSHLASAATTAADGVSEAVQNAGSAINDKYSSIKLGVEIDRMQTEQNKVFTDIGRTMFIIKTGELPKQNNTEDNLPDAQETIDRLLELAEKKQTEIDEATAKLSKLSGQKVCPVCGKISSASDKYCSECGNKLPE